MGNYPKEKIARANEKAMLSWLKANEKLLPLSIYALSKQLQWTFGATRGTLLRLYSQPQHKIHLDEIINPKTKRYTVQISLAGNPSYNRMMKQKASLSTANMVSQIPNHGSTPLGSPQENLSSLKIESILQMLKKLLEFDEKVLEMAQEIKSSKLLQRFLDLGFGLEEKEKNTLIELIDQLEAI